MYEALLKTPEYQKIAESLRTPGPAALFGLPPAGRALLYAALQKDLGRAGVHRDPRRGRGHPLCRRPQGAGPDRGGVPAPGLHAAAGGGRGPRVRVPPPVGAGRAGGRAAERRLRARRGAAAIHGAPG